MNDRQTIADLTKLIDEMRADRAAMVNGYERQVTTLRKALKRGLPWLGKLVADGGHLNSVAPNDAVGAMEQAQAALDQPAEKSYWQQCEEKERALKCKS